MVRKYIGELLLKKDSIDFGIYDKTKGVFDNISEELEEIIESKSRFKTDIGKQVRVVVEVDGNKVFNEQGVLCKRLLNDKYYDYYVKKSNLSEVLWNNTKQDGRTGYIETKVVIDDLMGGQN